MTDTRERDPGATAANQAGGAHKGGRLRPLRKIVPGVVHEARRQMQKREKEEGEPAIKPPSPETFRAR